MVLLRLIGEARFSGPGAPRCWPAIVGVAAVSAKMKSVALLFVSTGLPPLGHAPNTAGLPPLPHGSRKKLCSNKLGPIACRFVPSCSSAQTPVVLLPKPTASSRFAEERLSTSAVLKTATLLSLAISATV